MKNVVKTQHVNGLVSSVSNSHSIRERYPLQSNTRV